MYGACTFQQSNGLANVKMIGPLDAAVQYNSVVPFSAPPADRASAAQLSQQTNDLYLHEIVVYPVLTDAQMLEARDKLYAR